MNHYFTYTSTEGQRLPYSGFLIGRLAEALRLKTILREDLEGVSYKTVQRYFSGERIEPESVQRIIDALLNGLVPGELRYGQGYIADAHLGVVVASALKNYSAHWDRMAAKVNAHMFPVKDLRDLPMPVLRPAALDLGIRVGGWAVIRLLKDDPINREAAWLDGGDFGRYLDARRRVLGFTVEKLAQAVGVSPQALDAWRSGASLPTSNHIEALAKALAGQDVRRVEVEFTVRLLVAVDEVFSDLKETIGEDRLDDLVQGVKCTAQQVEGIHRMILSKAPPPLLAAMKGGMLRGAIWELPLHGARCPLGEKTSTVLAQKAKWREEAAADFAVLPGDWSPRVTYWMSHVGMSADAINYLVEEAPKPEGVPREQSEMIADAVVKGAIYLGNMFWEPEPGMTWTAIETPPFIKAMNRVSQAGVAASSGDLVTAVEHLRHAVRHQPQDASLHFSLGCGLWQVGLKDRDMAMVEEALLECRMAVQIDPAFGNARNEIGVILSNLRRHEEAEAAFAEAEPYHGKHNHHWLCRGNNYLALGRLADARSAFEKAIELTGEGQNVDAKIRLAATLMALAREREGRNIGRQVHHITGFDPTADWERWADPWGKTGSTK